MSSESKTPLLDESRAADNEARMIQLNKELTNIVTKIGYAMKNYTTNKEESEKMIIEVVDELDELEKQYTFRNFLSFLKSSSKEFIKDVKNGVIDVFRNNGGSIIEEKEKVTFKTPLGEESITNEETCNPMHMENGRQQQNGGFIFDPFSLAAIGVSASIATGITIGLAFIYIFLCTVFHVRNFSRNRRSNDVKWYTAKKYACLPVGIVLFAIRCISCAEPRRGGKLKTARKRFLIKKNRKSKAKKSKKSRK
jgi:hypothetical protein